MTLIGQAWAAQGQPISQGAAPTPPSPEVLKALTDLMNAISGNPSASDSVSWLTPEGLTSVAAFIGAVAWPALALVVIVKFSPQVVGLLSRTTKLEWLGIKAEIQTELNKAAEDATALAGRSKGASPGELQRAAKVEEIAGQGDIALVRQQVEFSSNGIRKYSRGNAAGRPTHPPDGSCDFQDANHWASRFSDAIRTNPITVTWPAFAGHRFPSGGPRLRVIGLVS